MGAEPPETIYALSSGPGRAAIAVIRVSGPHARLAVRELAGSPVPAPRRAVLRTMRDPAGGVLDSALILFFAGPASATGEDVAEFHVHGGRAVVAGVLAALARLPGLRPALPGEFTRRAVEKGRLDLTRAEALADLIAAETEAQRNQAFRQFEGALAEVYESWRDRLVHAAAWLEAAIDFAEEDIPEGADSEARNDVARVGEEIARHLADGHRGEILREGFHVAVLGPPNAGKSSLVNALARRDVAIVSEAAGTTRDVIEIRLDLKGYPVVLADTAGLREAGEAVEAEGVRRARKRAEEADFRLLLLDGSVPEPTAGVPEELLARADLVVWNKADLPWPTGRKGPRMSLKTGEGLANLIDTIAEQARVRLENFTESPVLTRARHRVALEEAHGALERAVRAPRDRPELAAEDVRLAMRALGRITGAVDIEKVLDVIFREFCIGK